MVMIITEEHKKFLGVEDPESYLDALHNLNWDNKIIPELNSYYKNNPNARNAANAYIDKRERIENEIENKYNKDVFIELQKRLKEMGLYDGQIDGIWGPKSEKAKDEYQKLRSISPNAPRVRFLYSPEKNNNYDYKSTLNLYNRK